jgi:hypothetical protein
VPFFLAPNLGGGLVSITLTACFHKDFIDVDDEDDLILHGLEFIFL